MKPLKKYRKNQWIPKEFLGEIAYWYRYAKGGIEVKLVPFNS